MSVFERLRGLGSPGCEAIGPRYVLLQESTLLYNCQPATFRTLSWEFLFRLVHGQVRSCLRFARQQRVNSSVLNN
jgi:hypothetical protein